MQYPTMLAIAGNIFLIAVLLLVGPVPFLNGAITPSLSYECGLMVIFGFGWALITVSTFGRATKAITNLGYNIDTNTMVLITGTFVRHVLISGMLKLNMAT